MNNELNSPSPSTTGPSSSPRGMYSLMPKVDGSEANSSGTTDRKVESISPNRVIKSSTDNSSSTLSLVPTSKSKAGLIGRVFGGRTKGHKHPVHDKEEIDPFFGAGEVDSPFTESPFRNPLAHKLVARQEPGNCKPKSLHPRPVQKRLLTIYFYPTDPRQSGMERHEGLPEWSVGESFEELVSGDLIGYGSAAPPGNSRFAKIEYMLDHQAGDLAVIFSLDEDSARSWVEYIQNYSGGKFNLIHPPYGPLTCPSFTHLPAMLPSSEQERMASSDTFENVWPHMDDPQEGPIAMLLDKAMKQFGVPHASVSFFDEKCELFKLTSFWKKHSIPRATSLAAHALLGINVFVILDTKQDWRFINHPLVIGKPKYRFFAASPMLAKDGLPVGVFSIWSNEPRANFSPFEQRELGGLGDCAMEYLQKELDGLNDPATRSTPLLDRYSVINGDYRPKHDSMYPTPIDPAYCPVPLRITPPTRSSGRFGDQIGRNLTPPSSVDSINQTFFEPSSGGYGNNHKDLMIDPSLAMYPHFQAMITPDSNDFGTQSSRPYSGSDITSIAGHPPNTPHTSFMSGQYAEAAPSLTLKHFEPQDFRDLTVDDFHSLSDDDVVEQINISTTELETVPNDNTPVADGESFETGSIDSTTSSRLQLDNYKFPDPDNRDRDSMTIPTHVQCERFSIDSEPWSTHSESIQSESDMVLRNWAKKLGYHRMYVVELKPTNPNVKDEVALCTPGGLQTPIVASYGLPGSKTPELFLHLKALRCRATISYEDIQSQYLRGLLCGIQTQAGKLSERNAGFVLAAFRKKVRGVDFLPITPAEHVEFKKAVDAISEIVLKEFANESLQPFDNPRPQNIHPAYLTRYPANEAIEVGDDGLSFDRRQSCASIISVLNDNRPHSSSHQKFHLIDGHKDVARRPESRQPETYRVDALPVLRQKNINAENSLSFASNGSAFQKFGLTVSQGLRQPIRQASQFELREPENAHQLHRQSSHVDLGSQNNQHSITRKVGRFDLGSFRTPGHQSKNSNSTKGSHEDTVLPKPRLALSIAHMAASRPQ